MKKAIAVVLCAAGLSGFHAIPIDVQNPSTNPAAQPPQVSASQSTPDTEVYLASLLSADGKLTVGPPINISSNPGYDNQPAFTADGNEILFASSRGAVGPARYAPAGSPATPATDIYRYGIASRLISRVTNTPEGEFSPIMMAEGNISVVRVEADGTQRLWRVANSNNARGASSVILPDIRPVGYYAWMDDHTVVLFILGQNGQPSTLQVADTQTSKAQVVAFHANGAADVSPRMPAHARRLRRGPPQLRRRRKRVRRLATKSPDQGMSIAGFAESRSTASRATEIRERF
jgi:hypothetical protein